MTTRQRHFGLLVPALAFGCSAVATPSGLDQPIRVHDAQLIEGPLPGTPLPPVMGSARPTPAPPYASALITNAIVTAGQPDKRVGDTASPETAAIAIALKGAGSGYWLALPTGFDQQLNLVQWEVSIDVAPFAPLGRQELLFAAVDANGRAGSQTRLPICIAPVIPDWVGDPTRSNACDPKQKPPAIVATLDWDAPVDLDLRVVTPAGLTIDSKRRTSAPIVDGGAPASDPRAGRFTTDSNANCFASGGNRENVVWDEQPAFGTYHIYANLFEACGEAAVHFNVSIRIAAGGEEPDTFKVVETFRTSGSLVAADANGGSKIGTFITDFQVQ
jgi:hypothetical protein